MHAERTTRSRGAESERSPIRPRVVILGAGEAARVKVLELPESTTLGGAFSYCGRRWRVTGLRTGSRVLIAEPVAH